MRSAMRAEIMLRQRTPLLLAGISLLAAAASAHGQFYFLEVGPERGIQPYVTDPGKGGGVAAADFDGDGDVDLFVPNAGGVPDQLYRNLGDGSFEEIAAQAGVDSTARSRVALWFDYDGDDLLDLFVAGDCYAGFGIPEDPRCPDVSTLRLYRQVAVAQFQDVTLEAGIGDDLVLSSTAHRGGLCAGDVNNDGYLDLVTGLWMGEARLFLNNTDGTFSDVRMSSGLGGTLAGWWQPMMHDFDGDGWMDVYHAVDYSGNRLWINGGDMTFQNVAVAAGTDSAWNDMGMTFGDYDNDGDIDLYITNITNSLRHNVLYRNDSDGSGLAFQDVAEALGVSSGGWGWGTTFFDADRDGDLDLAATNGWFAGSATVDASRFFLNGGEPPYAFTEVSAAVGFDDTLWGSAVIAVDFDHDGDQDLVQSCNGSGVTEPAIRLLANTQTGTLLDNHFLLVKPRMVGPNRRAIGAVVRATAGPLQMTRLITAGTSFYGQEPAEAFFGAGTAEVFDSVIVQWPDGTRTTITDVPVDQVLTVTRGLPGDVNGDGAVNVTDLVQVISNWGPCEPPCPSDDNGDGVVDVTDLIQVIVHWGSRS